MNNAAARPNVLDTNRSGRPSIDRAGLPINLIGFIYPSNPPRMSRDAFLTVFWSLLFAVPLAGVTIAIHFFR